MATQSKLSYSAEEFLALASDYDGIKLTGYVSKYSPTKSIVPLPSQKSSSPDRSITPTIMFGRSPSSCPTIPIPAELIVSMQLGQSHVCQNAEGIAGTMWFASIYIRFPYQSDQHAQVYAELLSLYASSILDMTYLSGAGSRFFDDVCGDHFSPDGLTEVRIYCKKVVGVKSRTVAMIHLPQAVASSLASGASQALTAISGALASTGVGVVAAGWTALAGAGCHWLRQVEESGRKFGLAR